MLILQYFLLSHCMYPLLGPVGSCPDLPSIPNGIISYSLDRLEPPSPQQRPFGTVATYTCDESFMIIGVETRTCGNGVFDGAEPQCTSGGGKYSCNVCVCVCVLG